MNSVNYWFSIYYYYYSNTCYTAYTVFKTTGPPIKQSVAHKVTSERPTQLNSTQLAIELSWVELSWVVSVFRARRALWITLYLTTQLNSTQLNWKKTENRSVSCQSRSSEHFQNWLSWVELSWVELSWVVSVFRARRALWIILQHNST